MPKGIPNNPRMSADRLLALVSPATLRLIMRDLASQRRIVQAKIADLDRRLAEERLRLMDLDGRQMWYALTGDDGPLRAVVEPKQTGGG